MHQFTSSQLMLSASQLTSFNDRQFPSSPYSNASACFTITSEVAAVRLEHQHSIPRISATLLSRSSPSSNADLQCSKPDVMPNCLASVDLLICRIAHVNVIYRVKPNGSRCLLNCVACWLIINGKTSRDTRCVLYSETSYHLGIFWPSLT